MMKSDIVFDITNKYNNSIDIKENKDINISSNGIYLIDIDSLNEINIKIQSDINSIIKINLNKDCDITLDVQKNSNIGFYIINKSSKIENIITINENSFVETYLFSFNENQTNTKIDLIGYNASILYNMGIYANNKDKHNHKTIVNHLYNNTLSNINEIGILNEESECIFDVQSYIKNISSKSSAYQKSKIINLSDKTKAKINPILLIDNYDVIGGHGATISKVNEDDLFYMQSRGIAYDKALKLIALGNILENVPKYMREEINKIIGDE